jgi:hypothetical protein
MAKKLAFPVFEMPWETKLAGVIQAIYNFIELKHIEEESVQDILEAILYGNIVDNYDNRVTKSGFLGL